jgi:phosphatidylinositol alpha 1,6-mannosyltransferase
MNLDPNNTAARVSVPRVAFFTDSHHEVNGVALTSREFARFARSRFYPFFDVHPGPRSAQRQRGSFCTCELAHSRMVLRLEHDLRFDLRFNRHREAVRQAVAAFKPDLVHMTGPGHIGMLGALIAYDLKVPLVASWHTNVHEFGARRLRKMLRFVPRFALDPMARLAERKSLDWILRIYRLAKIVFAPNPELVQMLAARTGKPVFLMQRGIDGELFSPSRRKRADGPFTIGYVGRLSAEKNVRLFAEIEASLDRRGFQNYRFSIVGEGSERVWLRERLRNAHLPGVLLGEQLAEAYADMDLFVFPSETDTFGNAILEAMSSGVPAAVSAYGGPRFLVEPESTGWIASSADEFAQAAIALAADPQRAARMRQAARQSAVARSWNAVFDGVYRHYAQAFETHCTATPHTSRNCSPLALPN